MKYTAHICKQCGSQTRGLVYDKELLEKDDLERIRICNTCKSEYFVSDEFENAEDQRLVEDLFEKVYKRIGLDKEQAIVVAKRMFINALKVR